MYCLFRLLIYSENVVEKLPLINYPHWLSTPNQTKSRKDSSCVQVVRGRGGVLCDGCGWGGYGVRPVFYHRILNLFILSITFCGDEDRTMRKRCS